MIKYATNKPLLTNSHDKSKIVYLNHLRNLAYSGDFGNLIDLIQQTIPKVSIYKFN